jgi:BNR repeat-like domain
MTCTRNGMAGSRGVGFGLVFGLLVALLGVSASAAFAQQSPPVVRVSDDPYTGPPGQHRTEVEPDTFSYRGQVVGAFQVGRIFAGGATNIGWVTSRDGGRHFRNGFLPGLTKAAAGPYDAASDPNVAYDAAHRVWLISSLAVNGAPVAVVVSRSRDGRRWEGPVTVAAGQQGQILDKNWTVCDNSRRSPFYGHCYTEFDDNGDFDRIKMSTSTDGGLSWSAPTNTAGNDLGIGGQPVVQPDGTVIVPIENLVLTGLQAFRSTDGGQTWSAAVPVTSTIQHQPAGGLRAPVFPSAEVDSDGKVYAAWQDCRFRTGCSANDIVISTTTDGVSWSPVERIPIDSVGSGADHFIPGLAVDPDSSGPQAHLALTYYSYPNANCTAASCELNVGFISSPDGGASWSEPIQLAGPMRLDWLAETSQGRMVGDYISTSFVRGRALPLFAQAGPPSGGLFDEAMATVQSGLPVGVAHAPASSSNTAAPPAQPRLGLSPQTAR